MDRNGYVANELETEQILQVESSFSQGFGSFSSFVITRGSIPLFWSQGNPIAPMPDFIMDESEPEILEQVCETNLLDMFSRYGPSLQILNLIRRTKHKEQVLGVAFTSRSRILKDWILKSSLAWWKNSGLRFLNKIPVESSIKSKMLAMWDLATEGENVDGLEPETNSVGDTIQYMIQK